MNDIKLSIRPLRELYGATRAADFGPLALKAVRNRMVADGLSRGVVNQRTGRIKRLFKWAVSEQLVPVAVLVGLQSVTGLQAGRTEARETEPVKPVRPEHVDAVLPFLRPQVAAIVRLMRLSGMRPGEACRMRVVELDMSGAVWVYRPTQHKNRHRGKERVICFGPLAQAIVRQFLQLDLHGYLFQPSKAVEGQEAERRAKRKSKRWPSHVRRQSKLRAARPRRTLAACYTPITLGRAIARACDQAFPPPAHLAQRDGETAAAWAARLTEAQRAELAAWRTEHRWHPNRLRHLHATEIRKRFGLEAAQVAMGHARADVTQIYAERNLALAEKIAGEVG